MKMGIERWTLRLILYGATAVAAAGLFSTRSQDVAAVAFMVGLAGLAASSRP